MSYDPPSGAPGQPGDPGQYGQGLPQYGEAPQYGQAPPQYGQAPPQYGQAPQYGAPGPYGYGQGPAGKPPSSYKAWGITCVICGVLFSIIIGLPCALVALRYGRKVQPAWMAGDQQGAVKASKRARTWLIISTVVEVLTFILVISLFSHGNTTTT